jgi:hypothetical protein
MCVCLFVCLYVCMCVCLSVRLYVSYLCARNARACACVLNAIFERILFKFAGNILRLTISVNDYVLSMFTHRAHACERACARACMIKYSLIYGPIHLKYAVNILKITTKRMGYLLFMFTHCAHTCERVRASARVVKTFTYRWTDSLQISWAHTTNDHKLHVLHTYHVHAPRARARD